MEVYCYIPAGDVDEAVECGLSLSKRYDREVIIGGELKKCITALLNPRDDIGKYRSPSLRCIKLDVPARHCFVSDGLLYRMGLKYPQVMTMYNASIIPIENYRFGEYRFPECLITTTLIAGQVSVSGNGLDSPLLFENSRDLYIGNLMEAFREQSPGFYDDLLYCYFNTLAGKGKYEKFEDTDTGAVLFVDRIENVTYITRLSDGLR